LSIADWQLPIWASPQKRVSQKNKPHQPQKPNTVIGNCQSATGNDLRE
jgi:hypothetical protein